MIEYENGIDWFPPESDPGADFRRRLAGVQGIEVTTATQEDWDAAVKAQQEKVLAAAAINEENYRG